MKDNVHAGRRQFLRGSLAWACTAAAAGSLQSADGGEQPANKICAFVKFIQSLPFDELAETIAEMGFSGIEATVRDGGQIEPERAAEELPRLVEALKKCGIEITVMASSINRVDQPHAERVLKTAASLGIPRYRMSYYSYDLKRPVVEQLEQLRPVLRELAAMNRQLGITGVYQNHAGTRYVGASLWDLYWLLKPISPEDIGAAFDIRHATVEGGTTWPVRWNLLRDHVGAVYVKDFRWEGRQARNVPLGEGQVDPAFFKLLGETGYEGPISLHIEYLERAGVAENLAALRRDLATLRALLPPS